MAVIDTRLGAAANEGRVDRGDGMPLERLEAEIVGWSGNLAAATAHLLGWIAAYDRREGWRVWGCRSAAHWLSWKCGESLHTAREKVRVARALEHLPSIARSFRAGELSYSKVRAVSRVATTADDEEWLEIAKEATGAELDRIAGAVRAALDRDDNRDARRAFERRCARRSTRSDDLDEIHVVGPRDLIDTVWAAAEMLASQLVDEAANGSGHTRRDVIDDRGGLGALRADAFQRLAEQAIAATPAAAERGDIGRLQLMLDTEFLTDVADRTEPVDGECTIGGARVAPDVARRWACDIRASVALEHDGHVHDEGRDSRTLNRRLRRAVHRRDRGMCWFPGCGATTWLHAHHIIHWLDGGLTNLDNLVGLCSFHHHLVHEGGWNVAIVDGDVVWTDPDGVPASVEPLRGDAGMVAAIDVPAGTIETNWHNDRLDFAFVVSVIADHCERARKRPRGDVIGGPPRREDVTGAGRMPA